MRARTIQAMLVGVVALLMVVGTAVAQERTPTTVPFDEALSIYAAHSGTWFNYNALQEAEAEIEDIVAAFEAWEQISDEPGVWAEHQINVPPIPEGWLFFEPVETEPMDLVVLIRDTQNRLGHVLITDRDTGEPIGTLQANPQGSEITGTVPVDPLIEAFNMEVKDATGATVMKAAPNNPRIDKAIGVIKDYGWVPNRGDQHTPCPAGTLGEPYGDPESLDGKVSTYPEQGDVAACLGPKDFEHDFDEAGDLPPSYMLKTKQVLGPPVGAPGNLAELARQEVENTIAEAKQPYEGGTDLPRLPVKPYSRGTGHWPVTLTGGCKAIIYFPYRGREHNKASYKVGVEGRLNPSYTAGVGKVDAAAAVVGSANWGPDDEKIYQALAPVAVGNVWGLIAEPASTPFPKALPEDNITAAVTIELWGDKVEPDGQPGYIGGTGSVTRDVADVTPAPPSPMPSQLALTFPWMGDDKGRCEVQLAKGWKWKGTGTTGNPAYSSGTVDPFPVPTEVVPRINVTLQALLRLIVKTIDDQQGQPCAAMIELYKQVGEQWQPLVTGQMTSYDNGEYVWRYGVSHVPPGTYKVRARWPGWPPPPWTEDVIAVGPDIEVIRTLAVSPPGGG